MLASCVSLWQLLTDEHENIFSVKSVIIIIVIIHEFHGYTSLETNFRAAVNVRH